MTDETPHEVRADNRRVVIDDEMTIYTAAKQKDELLAHLEADTELTLDLSAVTEIDSAGLQVLLLLERESLCRGHRLNLVNPSPAVLEVVELLHLGRLIDAPADPSEGAANRSPT